MAGTGYMCRKKFSLLFGSQGDGNQADPGPEYLRIVPPHKEVVTAVQLHQAVSQYYDLLLSKYAIRKSHFVLLCKVQLIVAVLAGAFYGVATSSPQSHSCLTSPLSRLLAATLACQALLSMTVIGLAGMCYNNIVKAKQKASTGAASILMGVENFKNEVGRITRQNEKMRLLKKNINVHHATRCLFRVLKFSFVALAIYFIVLLAQQKWSPWCASVNPAATSLESFLFATGVLLLPQLSYFLSPSPDSEGLRQLLEGYEQNLPENRKVLF
jgi:hypothetical protein